MTGYSRDNGFSEAIHTVATYLLFIYSTSPLIMHSNNRTLATRYAFLGLTTGYSYYFTWCHGYVTAANSIITYVQLYLHILCWQKLAKSSISHMRYILVVTFYVVPHHRDSTAFKNVNTLTLCHVNRTFAIAVTSRTRNLTLFKHCIALFDSFKAGKTTCRQQYPCRL